MYFDLTLFTINYNLFSSTVKLSLQIKLFQRAELVLATSTLVLFFLGLGNLNYLHLTYNLGRFYGQVSLILLVLTLLPGITRRLGILPITIQTLMPIRRHLGITMYLFGLSHYLLIYLVGQLSSGNFPPSTFPTFIIAGFWSLLLLTPLFITSNNFSLRLLKRNWFHLHKLVYLALLLILFHLALQRSLYALLAAALLFLELTSFVVFWHRNRSIPQPPSS